MKIENIKMDYRSEKCGEIETRSEGDDYQFSGYAVTWGSIDSYGSTFKRGAFKKTLKERGHKIKILWNHITSEPIGKPLEIKEDATGLFIRGQLTKGHSKADDVYLNLKAKVVDTLSFGFNILQDKINGGVKEVSEVKLYEVSPVTFEANETAEILEVRSKEIRSTDFVDTLESSELYHKGWQLVDSLTDTLWDIWWQDEEHEELVSLMDIAISDFHQAYIIWAKEYMQLFWEERKSAFAKNELQKTFYNEVMETREETLEQLASHTSFTVHELNTLSRGELIPLESRKKLVDLPESIRAEHQKERNTKVETLCNELRKGGFSEAEKERFIALLSASETRNEADPVKEAFESVRQDQDILSVLQKWGS